MATAAKPRKGLAMTINTKYGAMVTDQASHNDRRAQRRESTTNRRNAQATRNAKAGK